MGLMIPTQKQPRVSKSVTSKAGIYQWLGRTDSRLTFDSGTNFSYARELQCHVQEERHASGIFHP